MPLSEYEQRVLEQMERDLGTDAKLGSAMARGSRPRSRYLWAGLGVLLGLGIVVTGAVTQMMIVGVAGFAIMLLAAVWALLTPRAASRAASKPGQPAQGRAPRKSFMARMEERFERRREQGDL